MRAEAACQVPKCQKPYPMCFKGRNMIIHYSFLYLCGEFVKECQKISPHFNYRALVHVYVSHKPHLLGSLTGPVDLNRPGRQSPPGPSSGRTRTDGPR